MKKAALLILIIIGLIALAVIPSVWIARIIAVAMFIGLIAIGHDREYFNANQLNEYITLLELVALIFIIHIAISHGGVTFGE